MKVVEAGSRGKWIALLLVTWAGLTGAAAQDPDGAEDRSQWRFIADMGSSGLLMDTDMEDGPEESRLVNVYMVLATPHASGVDGMATRYSVSCRHQTITDLGGAYYAGASERDRAAPQNNGQPVQVETGTVFGVIGDYACNGRLPSIGNRRLVGRANAIDYVRGRLTRD